MYLLGFFTRKGDARSVWVGILFTMVFTAWTILAKNGLVPESLSVPFDLYYTGIIGNLLMFVMGYGVATFLPRKEKDLKQLTVWDH